MGSEGGDGATVTEVSVCVNRKIGMRPLPCFALPRPPADVAPAARLWHYPAMSDEAYGPTIVDVGASPVAHLTDRIRDLELEVARQWLINHAEHCGSDVPPWPHGGICKWQLPEVLTGLTPSELYLLLLQASGVYVGLRLQS